MNKSLLEEYCSIREEIKDTAAAIEKLEKKEQYMEHEIVRGSAAEFPFLPQNFKISGYDEHTNRFVLNEIRKQKKILRNQECKLIRLQTEVEAFIAELPQSRKRRIFRMYYIDNLNWYQVANRMGEDKTSDAYRKEHDRFLEKNSNVRSCPQKV